MFWCSDSYRDGDGGGGSTKAEPKLQTSKSKLQGSIKVQASSSRNAKPQRGRNADRQNYVKTESFLQEGFFYSNPADADDVEIQSAGLYANYANSNESRAGGAEEFLQKSTDRGIHGLHGTFKHGAEVRHATTDEHGWGREKFKHQSFKIQGNINLHTREQP